MRVGVRLFARYREAVGRDWLDLDLPEGVTVETVWAAVADRHPELAPYRPFTLFAVGNEYVSPDHRLRSGDELCLFPPVSGGARGGASAGGLSMGEGDLYQVTDAPLSADSVAEGVGDPAAGGIVIFSGVVRNEKNGRPVKYLEYEAHTPMAEAKMRDIGAHIHARWLSVKRVVLLHRIGRLEIGESSVLIAVSAAHRREAFEACHFAIDTLKETVPVWKKEYFEDGEVWVGLQGG